MRAPPTSSRLGLLLGVVVVAGCGFSAKPVNEDLNTGDAPVAVGAPDLGVAMVPVCGDTPARGYGLTVFADGLASPLFVTAPPADPDRVFVVQQGGQVLLFLQAARQPTPFLDVSPLTMAGGEQGLLGLALHPGYADNGRLFISYTDVNGNSHIDELNTAGNPNEADPTSRKNILFLTQPFANHNGGMIAFGPDGYLYMGFGDGGSEGDPQGNGQNLGILLSKILRLDVDSADGAPYAIPPDNPFVGTAGAVPETWAFGLRNPWRFSFDALTGDLYIGDVGQNMYEEIDVQPAAQGGQNYGWSILEGPHCYPPDQNDCDSAGKTPPVASYTHADGCSVTGGYVYRGCAIPELSGRYLYADYCTGFVRSFVYAGGAATDPKDHSSALVASLGGSLGSISSFGVDAENELYLTSYDSGRVFKLVPNP